MNWIEIATDFASLSDISTYFSSFNYNKLKFDLVQADLQISAKEWFSFSMIFGGIVAICLTIIAIILGAGIPEIIWALLLCSILCIFILLNLPAYLKRKRAEIIECEFSFALREIIVLLEMNMPYERVMKHIADGKYGALSKEFKRAEGEIGKGISIPEALGGIASRIDSKFSKRIVSQLIFSYEHGMEAAGLPKLADELFIVQKAKISKFSSKMALLGLIFIALCCLVPALFAAYVIIGSSFLSLTITAQDVYFTYLIMFPALGIGVLAVIWEKSPKILTF